MKRVLRIVAILLGLGAIALLVPILIFQRRLAAYKVQLTELEEKALASSADAESLIASGDYDLRVALHRPLIEKTMAALEGFEHYSRRGNRLIIREVEAHLERGYIRVEALADFEARLGWYEGPVKATYYAFAQLLEDGRCKLDFRLAQATPEHDRFLARHWLEPWLVLRLQSKHRLPELTLPLGIRQRLDLPAVTRQISHNQLAVTVPERGMAIHAQRPAIAINEAGLVAIVHRLGIGAPPGDTDQTPHELVASADSDFELSIRFSVLSAILDRLVEPERDALFKAERIESVWRKKSKFLGLKLTSEIDLENVDGFLNIHRGELVPQNDGWVLELDVSGRVEGNLKGRAYGIKVDQPFVAIPSLEEQVPIDITYLEDSLAIDLADRTIRLDLRVETELAGRDIAFNHPLELQVKELLDKVTLPQWLDRTIQIPTRMQRKTVLATEPLPIHLDWQVDLPADRQGFLHLRGTLAVVNQ